ncbi:MAG: AMP-binding protein [Acidimicrobiia bacterium]
MDWLARWARDRPHAPFLIDGSRVVDFAAASERIGRISGSLSETMEPGSRVGVVAHPTIDVLLTLLAVPLARMVLVPLPASGAAPESLADLTIVGPDDLGDGPTRVFDADLSETACAIFTSGSTGDSRAVRLTWANIEASAAASASHLDHRSDDRWLAVLPFHHVGGLSILWRSAREGSAVVLGGGFEATRTAAVLRTGGITLASFVSPMLETLADMDIGEVPGFRLGLVGGGPASERALGVGGMCLLPTYGMTETASQIATADPADLRPDRLVPLDGVALDIRDDQRIVVDGPMVSPGDLDGPDRGGPLVTGDLGRVNGGLLEVLGRADNVIVTGGENVMAERVERIVALVEGAGQVAVVGLADDRWGSVVAAAYTGHADPEALLTALEGRLGRHEMPRRWLRVDALPSLGIGKVDRGAVQSMFG